MRNNINIKVSNPTQYCITNNDVWAKFIITTGSKVSKGIPYNWVDVIISSSFVSMSYTWHHIGETDWVAFLNKPNNMNYFMMKLLNYDEMYEWDKKGAIYWVSSAIFSARRSGELSLSEARDYFDTLCDITEEHEFNEMVSDNKWLCHVEIERFIKIKPWVFNFWETLWVPFTTELANNKELINAV